MKNLTIKRLDKYTFLYYFEGLEEPFILTMCEDFKTQEQDFSTYCSGTWWITIWHSGLYLSSYRVDSKDFFGDILPQEHINELKDDLCNYFIFMIGSDYEWSLCTNPEVRSFISDIWGEYFLKSYKWRSLEREYKIHYQGFDDE